jgi:3D (Asp-Asp-Asp) domain-containing protein
MIRTSTKTSYPELVDNNVANSPEFLKKYTNYLNSIGSVSYDPPGLEENKTTKTLTAGAGTTQPPLILNNKNPYRNEDGSYEVEARITFYSPNEPTSDPDTRAGLGAKSNIYGKLLQGRSIAVDNSIIPYGSNVAIPNLGDGYLAMDTGKAVVKRTASQNTGGQPVIDVYVNSYEEQVRLERTTPSVVKVKVYPPDSISPPPSFVSTGTSLLPITTSSTTASVNELSVAGGKRELHGDLTPQSKTSINYWNAVKSGNPITNLASFYSKLDELEFTKMDNDFIYFWYKKLSSSSEIIQEEVVLQEKSFLSEPSDSIGILANTRAKFDDSVSPLFDLNCSFGAPATIPVSLENKLSAAAKSVNEELSTKTSTLMKTNLINIQRTNDSYNIAVDSTQSHGLNLVSDINFYQNFYRNISFLVKELTSEFDRTYEYVCYFSNINDKTGYNPRDYLSCNIQQISKIQFSVNMENVLQDLDVAQKKIKASRTTRTIEKSLGEVKITSQNSQTLTTQQINDKFKYKSRTYKIPKPVSSTQSAQAKLNPALSEIKVPNANLTNLNNAIDKVGINNIPNVQGLPSPATLLTNSVNNVNTLTQKLPLNMPAVLPSISTGSFPQIAALATDTNFAELSRDPQAILDKVQQTKDIACDFKLPVVGKIDFNDLINQDIDFDPDAFEAKLRSITDKFPKEDDFVKAFEKFKKDFDFKRIWDEYYKNFFTCDNKKDF